MPGTTQQTVDGHGQRCAPRLLRSTALWIGLALGISCILATHPLSSSADDRQTQSTSDETGRFQVASQSSNPLTKEPLKARQLMQDAQRWAEYGNLAAARALARRAASLNVDWAEGELSPARFLQQLDRPQNIEQTTTALPSSTTAVSYHVPAPVVVPSIEPPVSAIVEEPTFKLTEPPAPPTPATDLVAPAADGMNTTEPPARAATRPSESLSSSVEELSVADEVESPRRTNTSTESECVVQGNGPVPATVVPTIITTQLPAPAHPMAHMAIPIAACAVGLIFCPVVIVVGTLVACRLLGNCSPIIRVEFVRETPLATEGPVEPKAATDNVNDKAHAVKFAAPQSEPENATRQRLPEPELLSQIAAYNLDLHAA